MAMIAAGRAMGSAHALIARLTTRTHAMVTAARTPRSMISGPLRRRRLRRNCQHSERRLFRHLLLRCRRSFLRLMSRSRLTWGRTRAVTVFRSVTCTTHTAARRATGSAPALNAHSTTQSHAMSPAARSTTTSMISGPLRHQRHLLRRHWSRPCRHRLRHGYPLPRQQSSQCRCRRLHRNCRRSEQRLRRHRLRPCRRSCRRSCRRPGSNLTLGRT
jgi:hypothetical protein